MLSLVYSIAGIYSTIILNTDDPNDIEPIIGWCTFYPGTEEGIDCIQDSGATGLSVCGAGISVEKNEGEFDFTSLDKQIKLAEEKGLKLALISEVNPLFAPKWMRDKMRESDQAIKGYGDSEDPRDGGMPSIQSPIFKEIQRNIIRTNLEHIKERDTNRVITHYHPGAEWWFLPGYRYNHLDVDDFRKWLRNRYGAIDVLNARWKSSYASFDEVPAPAIDFIARDKYSMQDVVWVEDGGLSCSWGTELASDVEGQGRKPSSPEVTPGKTYTLSAWVKCDNLSAPGTSCAVSWIDEKTDLPIYGGGAVGPSVYGTCGWQKMSLTATAPAGAGSVQLSLNCSGAGTVTFDDISFVEEGSDINLAPNPGLEQGDDAPVGWMFRSSPTKREINHSYLPDAGHDGDACIQISSPRSVQGGKAFENEHAPANDWANYWYETGAEYINYCSGLYKEFDPTRKVATYLTFAFSFPAEWDYTQWTAISPDEVAMRGTNIDEIGLQTCAADKDPYRITACLDLIRKYGKPMWVVDLIDFTSGVNIGYEALDKITQSSIQHGATGLIYCSWYIPSVQDYCYYPYISTEDQHRMLTDADTSRKLVKGMEIKPKAALIEPILPASPADEEGFKNDFRSFMGWYKILESMHQTFDVVTLNEIEKGTDLSKYQWMLLPDCAYIQPKVLERLGAYINDTGHLLISGRFAEYDEIGNQIILSTSIPTVPDYGKAYTGRMIRDTHAGNTPPLFLWREDTPETDEALRNAKSTIRKFLDESGIDLDIEVSVGGPGLRSMIYDGDGSRAVYLVNMDDGNMDGVSLNVKFPDNARCEVYADSKAVDVSVDSSDGWTKIECPRFRSSCIVKLFTE